MFADVGAVGLEPFDVLHRLNDAGVLVNVVAGKVRFLTHRDVAAGDVERVIPVWRQVLDDARMEAGGRENR